MVTKLNCIPRFYAHYPKLRIGTLIRDEVVPYVKRFDSLPPKIAEKAISRAEAETTPQFFGNLERSWLDHNKLASNIDCFLESNANWNNFEVRRDSLSSAIAMFEEAVQVEDEKRVYSAGVKHALNRVMEVATVRYRLSDEEIRKVFTLWHPSFWVFRNGAHASLVLSQRTEVPNFSSMSTQELCNVFHGGSELVLRERGHEPWFARLKQMDSTSLQLISEQWQAYVSAGVSLEIEAGYLTLGRPDLQAARNLVRYDNLTELLFGENLWGLPDLLLRKMTVNTLVRLGRLDARSSVLMYDIAEIKEKDKQ